MTVIHLLQLQLVLLLLQPDRQVMLTGPGGRIRLVRNRAEAEQFEDTGIVFSEKREVRDVPEDALNTFLATNNHVVRYTICYMNVYRH